MDIIYNLKINDTQTIPLIINKHLRYRNLSIKICNKENSFKVTAPFFLREKQIYDFINKNHVWIIKNLPHLSSKQSYESNSQILIFNKKYIISIIEARTNSAHIEGNKLIIAKRQNSSSKRIILTFLNQLLLDYAKKQINLHSHHFHELREVKIKNVTSRWGSCSSNKVVMLSLKLIQCPEEVINYVIIHELSHLKEMNHSNRFWSIVSDFCPDYKKHQKWIRDNRKNIPFL